MNMKILFWVTSAILVATSSLHAGVDLVVSGIPGDSPFAIEAKATATDLIVVIALEPEWHVYSRDVGGGQPVAVTTDSDSAIVATGALQLPQSDSGKLSGAIRLRLPIGLGKDQNSTRLNATMRIQVCDALECLPPMEIKVSGNIPSLKVLLVVGAEDERTTRVETWLKSRGFESTTKTYADVSEQDCNGHDVVVADSMVFGKTNAKRVQVHKFPKSETPLVAIGFNGTELIESHEIAMTSGYI
jgi:hypothetical protein